MKALHERRMVNKGATIWPTPSRSGWPSGLEPTAFSGFARIAKGSPPRWKTAVPV